VVVKLDGELSLAGNVRALLKNRIKSINNARLLYQHFHGPIKGSAEVVAGGGVTNDKKIRT
jgi:hypothetical protein